MSPVIAGMPVNTPKAWSERASAATPWEAAGWSEKGQIVRMAKALELLAPQPGESLLDFGCGTGRLSDLAEPCVFYSGFDWAKGMIARARFDHPALRHRFSTELATDAQFDVIACVGPFNLAVGWSTDDTWLELRSLWGRCNRALYVSLYAGDDERCIRYRPSMVAAFAERTTANWRVERYLPNDLALLLERD